MVLEQVKKTASILIVGFLFSNPHFDGRLNNATPRLYLTAVEKIGSRPGIITMSQNRNGGHGLYKPSPPFPVRDVLMIPGLLPIFLHGCEIKSGSGLGTRLLSFSELTRGCTEGCHKVGTYILGN